MITGVVLVKNEEENIARCLDSLAFCDEILLIDNHSTDRTLKIASKYTKNLFNEVYIVCRNAKFSNEKSYQRLDFIY